MKNQNIGSNFDDFLLEEGMLEETAAIAVKRVIAWQIAQAMKGQKMTKTSLAEKMRTSRASLNRLLDENDGPKRRLWVRKSRLHTPPPGQLKIASALRTLGDFG
jgi:antitoxin HicB